MSLASAVHAGDWQKHVAELTSLQGKIRQLETDIHHLIDQKKHSEDPATIKSVSEQISKAYGELAKVSEEYREEQLHVRFKHPEKGDETERKYSRYTLKSLRELEEGVGLEAVLDRLKGKVQTVYGMKKPAPIAEVVATPTPEASRVPAQATPSSDGERIRLVK